MASQGGTRTRRNNRRQNNQLSDSQKVLYNQGVGFISSKKLQEDFKRRIQRGEISNMAQIEQFVAQQEQPQAPWKTIHRRKTDRHQRRRDPSRPTGNGNGHRNDHRREGERRTHERRGYERRPQQNSASQKVDRKSREQKGKPNQKRREPVKKVTAKPKPQSATVAFWAQGAERLKGVEKKTNRKPKKKPVQKKPTTAPKPTQKKSDGWPEPSPNEPQSDAWSSAPAISPAPVAVEEESQQDTSSETQQKDEPERIMEEMEPEPSLSVKELESTYFSNAKKREPQEIEEASEPVQDEEPEPEAPKEEPEPAQEPSPKEPESASPTQEGPWTTEEPAQEQRKTPTEPLQTEEPQSQQPQQPPQPQHYPPQPKIGQHLSKPHTGEQMLQPQFVDARLGPHHGYGLSTGAPPGIAPPEVQTQQSTATLPPSGRPNDNAHPSSSNPRNRGAGTPTGPEGQMPMPGYPYGRFPQQPMPGPPPMMNGFPVYPYPYYTYYGYPPSGYYPPQPQSKMGQHAPMPYQQQQQQQQQQAPIPQRGFDERPVPSPHQQDAFKPHPRSHLLDPSGPKTGLHDVQRQPVGTHEGAGGYPHWPASGYPMQSQQFHAYFPQQHGFSRPHQSQPFGRQQQRRPPQHPHQSRDHM